MNIQKNEVEQKIGFEVTDEQFETGLQYAKRKQELLLQAGKRHASGRSYLLELAKEAVMGIAFSDYTVRAYAMLRDMEKERQFKEHGTPSDNHILSEFAL